MRANELMIGDFLQRTYNHKIVRVREIKQSCIYTENNGYDYSEVEPIPLTPEILEKNGFKKDKYGQMVLNEELGTSEIYIVLQDGVECYWWVVNSELITKIRYVHQLQHALRLCRIEKEIELWLKY